MTYKVNLFQRDREWVHAHLVRIRTNRILLRLEVFGFGVYRGRRWWLGKQVDSIGARARRGHSDNGRQSQPRTLRGEVVEWRVSSEQS